MNVKIILSMFAGALAASRFLKRDYTEGGEDLEADITPDDIRGAIEYVLNVYGEDLARKVEQIYRLETNHFKSKQFKRSLTAGMAASKAVYPFGWSSLKQFHQQNPDFDPFDLGSITMHDASQQVDFLRFPNLTHAMAFLAFFLKKYGGRVGRWHRSDSYPEKQAKYKKATEKIAPKFLNQILAA